MDIWETRKKSNSWLKNELVTESKIIRNGFELLSKCIDIFNTVGSEEGESLIGQFCRICAVTLGKSSNLLLGCYSLALDGLSQESGAIFRPLIETYELLAYIRLDNARVDQVINRRLPPAGKIAKKISGKFQDLRKHLNDNASHFRFEIDSVRHLFTTDGKIKALPIHSLDVFLTNQKILNAFQIFILIEAANCLFSIGHDANRIADNIETWKVKSMQVFK